MLKLLNNCTHLTCYQSNIQNSPSQASTVREPWTSTCSSWKRQRNQRSNCQHPTSSASSKTQETSRKTSTSALLTMPKPCLCGSQQTVEKFFKRWEYQTTWPVSWNICKQVKKQQLELDPEQLTGFKSGKEYVKPVYCHPAYLTYMQSTSHKMPGWMKHKLESRLPGKCQ